ncbi:MAG: sugar phosphate isomerase [Paenibacillus sp.]|jgi:sugar phosphate isomerase/epimerase|nr:sugar phosphate isomerase [Paenibacillus sp.]
MGAIERKRNSANVEFSVFTKPWPALEAEPLAEKVRALGFHGIELPVRDGFQVKPRHAPKKLPEWSRLLAPYGLRIYSIAGPPEEAIFAACAEAGVPVIRIMPDIDLDLGYWESERRMRADLERLQPLCERYGVKVGLQQHVGRTRVKTSAGLLRLLEGTDPRWFGAVWDAGHDGLRGEGPQIGLDMVWSHLCMVNLKNGYYYRASSPNLEQAEWRVRFTTGRDGMASWPAVADYLRARRYSGVVCLTAEYDDEKQVDRYIAEDIAYAKSLFDYSLADGVEA